MSTLLEIIGYVVVYLLIILALFKWVSLSKKAFKKKREKSIEYLYKRKQSENIDKKYAQNEHETWRDK